MKTNEPPRVSLFLILLVVAFVVMLSVPAFATKTKEPPIVVEQDQVQGQHQDQMQHQNQAQDQSQSQNVDQANSQAVSFSTHKQAASAIAPGIQSSNPCYYGKSGAIGFDRVNLGGGKQKADPECELREATRLLLTAGERELAVKAICTSTALVEALGEECKPSPLASDRIAELEDRIKVLLTEREKDLERCKESNKRAMKACEK